MEQQSSSFLLSICFILREGAFEPLGDLCDIFPHKCPVNVTLACTLADKTRSNLCNVVWSYSDAVL